MGDDSQGLPDPGTGFSPAHAQDERRDPEPISLAILLLEALAGSASIASHIAGGRTRQRRRRGDQLKGFHRADRALNAVEHAFRDAVSLYEEFSLLDSPFEPADAPLYLDRGRSRALQLARREIFHAGGDLQDALADLDVVEGAESVSPLDDLQQTLYDRVYEIFATPLSSQSIRDFLISLGELLVEIGRLVRSIGEGHGFRSAYDRSEVVQQILDGLRADRPEAP